MAGRTGAPGLYAALAGCAAEPDALARLQRLCQTAVELLGVTGTAVTLTARSPSLTGTLHTLHATNDVGGRLEDLQHAAGQGPSVDAVRLERPVSEPDLAAGGSRRWPVLADAAVAAGAAAVASFPLQLDGTTVGTLDAYRHQPGELTDPQLADGRALAALVLRELSHVANTAALEDAIRELSPDRAVIEQATGMVAAQRGTSVTEAAERVRAYARDHRRPVIDVARNIVDGRLRLD